MPHVYKGGDPCVIREPPSFLSEVFAWCCPVSLWFSETLFPSPVALPVWLIWEPEYSRNPGDAIEAASVDVRVGLWVQSWIQLSSYRLQRGSLNNLKMLRMNKAMPPCSSPPAGCKPATSTSKSLGDANHKEFCPSWPADCSPCSPFLPSQRILFPQHLTQAQKCWRTQNLWVRWSGNPITHIPFWKIRASSRALS